MIPVKHLLTGILAVLTTACASIPAPDSDHRQLNGLYDYRIIDPDTDKTLSVTALADQWQDADVIIIGEFHGHNGAHLLEAQLQSALYKLRPNQVLSMEQFTVDHQTAVDRYLAGETGEEELIKEGAAWNNYKASYRPLVAFAADHHLSLGPMRRQTWPDASDERENRLSTGYRQTSNSGCQRTRYSARRVTGSASWAQWAGIMVVPGTRDWRTAIWRSCCGTTPWQRVSNEHWPSSPAAR